MSGAFFGSLAASASVFVAILTALLVNNYVRIRSDWRKTKSELERVGEELDKFENLRDYHQETINELTGRREQRYKTNAKERVTSFIENEVPSQISQPIEELSIDHLYYLLSDYHNFDSPEEMEKGEENYHRQILKDQYDQIENTVLQDITSSFAKDYDITGRRSRAVGKTLREAMEETEDEDSSEDISDLDGIEIQAEGLNEEPEPVNFDKFIEEFKREYSLDNLQPKTREALKKQYDRAIEQSEMERLQSAIPESMIAGFSEPVISPSKIFDSPDITTGLGIQEKARLQEARKDFAHAENQIETLQRRKNNLEDEKSRLNAEELIPVLTANVVTIILSVVIPIFAYLLFISNTTIMMPSWAWIISHTEVNAFLSWLFGLIVVFESIHAQINDREPKAYNLYLSLKNRLSPKTAVNF